MDRADTVAIMAAILFGKVDPSDMFDEPDLAMRRMRRCVSRAADIWDIAAERDRGDRERASVLQRILADKARVEQGQEEG